MHRHTTFPQLFFFGGGDQSTALNSFLYSIINVKISHIKKILEFNLISTLKLHCGITASRIVSRINYRKNSVK